MRFVFAAALLVTTAGFASAEPEPDHAIAAAAARIVAQNIGAIRGGFSFDEIPDFVVAVDWHPHAWSGPAHAL